MHVARVFRQVHKSKAVPAITWLGVLCRGGLLISSSPVIQIDSFHSYLRKVSKKKKKTRCSGAREEEGKLVLLPFFHALSNNHKALANPFSSKGSSQK